MKSMTIRVHPHALASSIKRSNDQGSKISYSQGSFTGHHLSDTLVDSDFLCCYSALLMICDERSLRLSAHADQQPLAF